MITLILLFYFSQARNYIDSLPKMNKRDFKQYFVGANPVGKIHGILYLHCLCFYFTIFKVIFGHNSLTVCPNSRLYRDLTQECCTSTSTAGTDVESHIVILCRQGADLSFAFHADC